MKTQFPWDNMHYDQADFERLLRSDAMFDPSLLMNFDGTEDASVFFARELEYIKSKSYDKIYPEFTALSLFPVSSEVPAGAETATYYSYDKTGFAKIISNYATDLPRADVKGQPNTVNVKSIGVSYGYSVQEMRASRMAGKSLDIRKAEAARYQSDRKIDEIAWAGDAANGLVGILSSNNNIPLYTLIAVTADQSGKGQTIPGGSSTQWIYKSADQILDDINGMYKYQLGLTMGVERADTLALPFDVEADISTRRLPTYSNETIKSFLMDKCKWLKNIVPCAELQAASTTTNPTGKNVAMLYKKDPEKFTLEIPMMFYQYPLQPENLEIKVPCEARCAGIMFYYPLSILLAEGV